MNSPVGSIQLSVDRRSVAESDGPTTVTVTAEFLPQGVLPTDTDVSVTVSGRGTASAVDFAPIQDFVITIPMGAGSASGSFVLTPQDDQLDEADETLTVKGSATLPVKPAELSLRDGDPLPIVSIRALNQTSEPGRLDYSIYLDRPSGRGVIVEYYTTNHFIGTGPYGYTYRAAETGVDFVDAGRNRVLFQPGETRKTVSVQVLDDAEGEPVEIVVMSFFPIANARTPDGQVTSANPKCRKWSWCGGDLCCVCGLIIDNDPPALSVASVSAEEGSRLDFVVSASFPVWRTATVRYNTGDGTAVSGQDYQATQGTLTFAPGESSKTASVATVDDTLVEPGETLALTLSSPTEATLDVARADGTIVDNDAPQLSVSGFSGVEGGTVQFLVLASFAAREMATVRYETSDGTAVSGQDYQATQGTLTFAPGDWNKQISVAIVDDALVEAPETLTLTLSSPTKATLGVASAGGTILDNDRHPRLSVAGASVAEGGTVEFAVRASATSVQEITVGYATADGTAVAGQDYQAAQGTLTFAPGETRKKVSVATVDDALDEPAEAFSLTLSSPANATLGTSSANGEIVDDDASPELSVAGASAVEGGTVEFVVSASVTSVQEITVGYATADGTAVADQDYQAAQGTLTFAPGETSRKVSVATVDDALDEPAETFALTLSSPANATLGVSNADGEIVDDDDAAPQLSVAGASGAEGSAVAFVVSASSTGGQTITVDYATTDGSAVAGRDYRAARGTLVFGPGELTRTVSVATLDDSLDEGTETFALTLSSSSNVEFGARTATGTILDNDAARVLLTAAPAAVPEGAGPTAVRVTAILEGALRDAATVVRVSVTGGSAQESVDFAAVPDFQIEIAAGAASGTGSFTLSPVDDDQEEADETLTVSGVSDLAVDAAALSLQDDDERPLETFRVLLFEAASNPLRQGFLRVINNSPTSGEVLIEATDDSGDRREPVSLFIEEGHAAHFNSIDLEAGNPAKRLSGGVGAPTRGDWRLKMSTSLDVDVLAYARTKDSQARTSDAFVTAMNDVVPTVGDRYQATFFNPGANQAQKSMLRLINTGLEDMEATVTGIDDAGRASGTVRVSIPSLETVTLTAEELETGVAAGIAEGRLGQGTGKWRLTISASPALVVKALLLSVDKLTNLSSSRDVRTVPVFPSMSEPDWTGLLRVVSRSPESGEVTMTATDATGRAYEPLTFTLGAQAAMHFNSADLELGHPGKGLAGSTGAGSGNWRLELDSPLDVYAVAYARSHDGFLTSIHDLVPEVNGVHRANFFNPASNRRQVSWLHLISDSDADALVTITGRDDRGHSPGSPVRLQVLAGTAVMLPSAALESGEHDLIESGALGDGAGKWRLEVTSDQPMKVMSLLVSPTGHLSNVSTAIDPFDATRPEPGG